MQQWLSSTVLLIGGAFFAAATPLTAQMVQPSLLAPEPTKHGHQKPKKNAFSSEKSSLSPAFEIATAPIGFAPPSAHYFGQRVAQLSLDFLDEDHLLFTFRIPGLISRAGSDAEKEQGGVRHIRAVVLNVQSGQVTAEAVWTLHDADRYLWTLSDHHFLLRDQNTIQRGDASLHLDPFLRFPGKINSLDLAPDDRLIVVSSEEAMATASSSDSSLPSTVEASIVSDAVKSRQSTQSLIRIISMETRKVMLFSHTSGPVHLAVDGEGYYEALRGKGMNWSVLHDGFRGASQSLGMIESTCSPPLESIAPGFVLASSCLATGGRKLTLLSQSKRSLWETSLPANKAWPTLARAPKAMRIARATLEMARAIGPNNPLDFDDVRGQSVQVYDLANGKLELTAQASPVLDAGGNFALSPSGERFAVLNAGAIQVFMLPPAPALPQ